MKIVNKLSGFMALVAMIGSTCMPLVSCVLNVEENKPGVTDPGAVIMNISEVTEWDWLLATKDGSVMLFDVDETTEMPTRLYLKPADEAVENGITFSFKENGLLDVIECNGYLLYFDNFDGYMFDLAVIAPDGSVEYHFGIETDRNFDDWDALYMSGGARSAYSGGRSIWDVMAGGFSDDPVGSALDVLGLLVDIGTCVAAVFFPPLVIGCITGMISLILDEIIFFLNYFLEEYETGWEMSGLAKDGYLLITGALGCVKAIVGKDLDVGAWFDCIGTFVGAVSLIVGVVQDLFGNFFSSGKKAEVQEEMTPSPVYANVNFYSNGGNGAVPASMKVEKNTSITLPDEGGLSRYGYTFLGWGTSPAGNFYSVSPYTVTRSTSFYAKWRLTADAPAGVTAAVESESSITVSWSAVSGAIAYYVYRGESANGEYSQVATVWVPATSYTDTGLDEDTVYYYKVSYYTGPKESEQSDYAYAKTPGVVVTYEIGDTGPGGGKIFYYSAEGFTMTDNNQVCHYLEAAPADMPTTLEWSTKPGMTSFPSVSGTGKVIGTGRRNTALILATEADAPAALACKNYNAGGKTDWFLPSQYELGELHNNRSAVGNFTGAGDGGRNAYWSSSQDSYQLALCLPYWSDNPTHHWGTYFKNDLCYVRAVRAF